MGNVVLTADERTILMGYKRTAPYVLMKAKAEAMLLLSEQVPMEVVARFVERAESTITQWARDWDKGRISSLYTGHADNSNASKLTPEQRREVTEVLAQPPSSTGLPAQFWTVPDLAAWLEARFDVVYESPASYHFLLHTAGLSFHKPEPFDRRRADDAAIEARIEEIRAAIQDDLADEDTLVLAADEVRIDQEAVVRRAWYAKGTKTKLLVNRERESQNYIGFLDQNTGACKLIRLEWQNGPLILDALHELVGTNPNKKITIVWDNASWHKSKVIRNELTKRGTLSDVRLIAFPPYTPDHNPIEHVWGEAKAMISNIQRPSFAETRQAFEQAVTGTTYTYRI